jgi:hypothetical protein
MPDADLVAAIRAVLAASPFHGEGHRKVWARLRHAGVRTSKRRVLRLMGAHNLLGPSRVGSPRGPRSHDIVAPKDRAGQGVRLAWMNCRGDLYRRARCGWISL